MSERMPVASNPPQDLPPKGRVLQCAWVSSFRLSLRLGLGILAEPHNHGSKFPLYRTLMIPIYLAMSTFRRLAPWLLLGPVSGPLAEGVHRNVRAKNPGLASLYALAAVVSWYDLATYGGNAVATLHRMMF